MTKANWAYMIVDQAGHDVPILANDWESYNAPRLPCTSVRRLTKRPKRQVFPLTPSRPLSRAYNEAIAAGKGKTLTPVNTLPKARTVEKAPFYIVPFQGGMTATFGGPLINVKGQVLRYGNHVIDGLFAIGNAAGGLFYDNYIGGASLRVRRCTASWSPILSRRPRLPPANERLQMN